MSAPNIARVRELAAALRDGTARAGDLRELGEMLPAVLNALEAAPLVVLMREAVAYVESRHGNVSPWHRLPLMGAYLAGARRVAHVPR